MTLHLLVIGKLGVGDIGGCRHHDKEAGDAAGETSTGLSHISKRDSVTCSKALSYVAVCNSLKMRLAFGVTVNVMTSQ